MWPVLLIALAAAGADPEPASPLEGHLTIGVLGGLSWLNPFGLSPGNLSSGALTYDGALRLGWAFDPLDLRPGFRPQLSLQAEGYLGVTDWSCCTGAAASRALLLRLEAKLLRTSAVDLQIGAGAGARKDAPPGTGFFGSCPEQESSGASSNCDWRFALDMTIALELHASQHFHLLLEPRWGAVGRSTWGFRLGFIFR